jgi:hypothetical protein
MAAILLRCGQIICVEGAMFKNIPTESLPTDEEMTQSFTEGLVERCKNMMERYWCENPDLYALIQKKKKKAPPAPDGLALNSSTQVAAETPAANESSILGTPLRGARLREKINASHRVIRQHVREMNAEIIPRTKAHNRKSACHSLDEEREFRADAVAEQIRVWRSQLPMLIKRFAKIPDYRRTTRIKHKITVLLVFGLFSFIFRFSSRREMNRELTSPVIFDSLNKLFPEIDSIPHADTLTRLLEKTNPREIEATHIALIKTLIKKKKFRKMLIEGCLPITIDGTQKLCRQGLVQDERWCERKVGNPEDNQKQQYVYVLEANITLKNGLSIPLMSEYLFRDNNKLKNTDDKQDCETTAFERLAERLKKYFPRLKIMLFMDAMFATQTIMGILHENHWEYVIVLPKRKLTDFAKLLNKNKSLRIELPNQSCYRKRKQSFYWENSVTTGYEWQIDVNLIACLEEYEVVNNKTGEIETHYSEHAWISSIPAEVGNLHELLNCGARKLWLIENSINTEKNRGYHYKHAFSYNWNAMQGFHYLMRLGHAINAISEFSKKLKHYIKSLGCSATLKLIKETLFGPWLSSQWYVDQHKQTPQLRLQLE